MRVLFFNTVWSRICYEIRKIIPEENWNHSAKDASFSMLRTLFYNQSDQFHRHFEEHCFVSKFNIKWISLIFNCCNYYIQFDLHITWMSAVMPIYALHVSVLVFHQTFDSMPSPINSIKWSKKGTYSTATDTLTSKSQQYALFDEQI